jgi:hypothetical protein
VSIHEHLADLQDLLSITSRFHVKFLDAATQGDKGVHANLAGLDAPVRARLNETITITSADLSRFAGAAIDPLRAALTREIQRAQAYLDAAAIPLAGGTASTPRVAQVSALLATSRSSMSSPLRFTDKDMERLARGETVKGRAGDDDRDNGLNYAWEVTQRRVGDEVLLDVLMTRAEDVCLVSFSGGLITSAFCPDMTLAEPGKTLPENQRPVKCLGTVKIRATAGDRAQYAFREASARVVRFLVNDCLDKLQSFAAGGLLLTFPALAEHQMTAAVIGVFGVTATVLKAWLPEKAENWVREYLDNDKRGTLRIPGDNLRSGGFDIVAVKPDIKKDLTLNELLLEVESTPEWAALTQEDRGEVAKTLRSGFHRFTTEGTDDYGNFNLVRPLNLVRFPEGRAVYFAKLLAAGATTVPIGDTEDEHTDWEETSR